MIPVVFRAPRTLRALNIAAVGLSIAAMTTAAFVCTGPPHWKWSIIVGLPTLVIGVAWAAALRLRETIGPQRMRVGWALSVPFAALNGGLACGLLLAWDSPDPLSFFGGLVMGATLGALVWFPAMLLVLVLFGVPIARAQRLATRGLAGEERGEVVVGLTSAALAGVALALVRFVARPVGAGQLGSLFFHAFVVLAAAFGVTAVFVALRREARRRRFVARVEAEEEPGLRVEDTTLGKMLVRVDPRVETYRIALAPDEELIELDREGRAVRAMR